MPPSMREGAMKTKLNIAWSILLFSPLKLVGIIFSMRLWQFNVLNICSYFLDRVLSIVKRLTKSQLNLCPFLSFYPLLFAFPHFLYTPKLSITCWGFPLLYLWLWESNGSSSGRTDPDWYRDKGGSISIFWEDIDAVFCFYYTAWDQAYLNSE